MVVVGGTSFVGGHVLPRLVAAGLTVHATARGVGPKPDVPGVQWVSGDMTAPDPTAAWPARCDAVIYLAQSREWRRFPEGAADVFAVNVRGVFQAAEYGRRAGAARLIFASSGSVYQPSAAPAAEHDGIDVTEVRQFYAASKLSAELLLGAYTAVMRVIVLRLFVPYGAGQGSEMLIPRLIQRVRQDEPILLDGEDGLRVNPVAVADVVETIERCLTADRTATLNVAGPEVLTLREIGHHIGRVVGRAPRFEQRPGSPPSIVGATDAMRATLGWAPATSMADGLRGWAAQ